MKLRATAHAAKPAAATLTPGKNADIPNQYDEVITAHWTTDSAATTPTIGSLSTRANPATRSCAGRNACTTRCGSARDSARSNSSSQTPPNLIDAHNPPASNNSASTIESVMFCAHGITVGAIASVITKITNTVAKSKKRSTTTTDVPRAARIPMLLRREKAIITSPARIGITLFIAIATMSADQTGQ